VTIPTLGDYQVLVNLSTSNLIDTIATSGSTGPTADSIAAKVWDSISANHLTSGTFGLLVNLMKATGDANFTQISTVNAKLDVATDLINTLIKYSANRTKVDNTAMTMTVYNDDGVTPLRIFDLKNFAGSPSITEIAERSPR